MHTRPTASPPPGIRLLSPGSTLPEGAPRFPPGLRPPEWQNARSAWLHPPGTCTVLPGFARPEPASLALPRLRLPRPWLHHPGTAAAAPGSAPRTRAARQAPAPPPKPARGTGPVVSPQARARAQASPPWRGISPPLQPPATNRPAPRGTPVSTTAATGEGARVQPPASPSLSVSASHPGPASSRPLPGGALGLYCRVFPLGG